MWCLVVSWLAVASPPSSQPAEDWLTGSVVDAGGKPVGGADVWLVLVGRGLEEPTATTTDAAGAFRIRVPPPTAPPRRSLHTAFGYLIAHSPDDAVGILTLDPDADARARPQRVTLPPPVDTVVTVTLPDGKPASDAEVVAGSMKRTADDPLHVALPKNLSARLTTRTDAQGRTTLRHLPAGTHALVRIEHRAIVPQSLGRPIVGGEPQALRIAETGDVAGRVEGAPADVLKNVTVILSSQSDGTSHEERAYAHAEVKPEEDGRFHVKGLLAGMMGISVKVPADVPFRAEAWRREKLPAGDELAVAVKLQTAVHVRGVVREEETRRPLEGVSVMIQIGQSADSAVTDAEGRYAGYVVGPGRLTLRVMPPATHLEREFIALADAPDVPLDATEYDYPPIELVRAATLHGEVVDADGQPVAGASVFASWLQHEGTITMPRNTSAQTDRIGKFVLEGLDPHLPIRVEASHQDARMEGPVTVTAGQSDPLVLRVSAGLAASLAGRVVDRTGRGVEGVKIEVWQCQRGDSGLPRMQGGVTFDGQRTLSTDADGRYKTPNRLDPVGEYRVVIRDPSWVPNATGWFKLDKPGLASAPDLLARGLTTVRGRVTDRAGKPIAGATVSQSGQHPRRTRTVTDSDGRFELDGVPEGDSFIFVSGPQLRFGGMRLSGPRTDVKLVAARTDEKPLAVLKTRPPPVSRERRAELVERLLGPWWEAARKQEDVRRQISLLSSMARVDVRRALRHMERDDPPGAADSDSLRRSIADALRETSIDECLAIIETLSTDRARAQACIATFDKSPSLASERRRDILMRAYSSARLIGDPVARVPYMGQIARRLDNLGDKDQAEAIFAQTLPTAGELGKTGLSGYARGSFAVSFCHRDLEAALKLIDGLSDTEQVRYRKAIAGRIAEDKPANAERLIREAHRSQFLLFVEPIIYSTASSDAARARRIAELDTHADVRAYALAVLAAGQARNDRDAACDLFREVVDSLSERVERNEDYFNGYTCAGIVTAAMLPLVESVDPSLVHEYLWQAMSLRPAREAEFPETLALSDAALAMLVARYDADLARALLLPCVELAPSISRSDFGRPWEIVYRAAALIDPALAVEMIERLPEIEPASGHLSAIDRARNEVLGALTSQREPYWDRANGHLHLWLPGTPPDEL